GPFITSRSEGINIPWTYALTNSDSVGVNYTLSRNASDQTFGATPSTTGLAWLQMFDQTRSPSCLAWLQMFDQTRSTTGLPPITLRTHTSSRSFGTAWAHDTGNE